MSYTTNEPPPKRRVTGLRSAVRYGVDTPRQALDALDILEKNGAYVRPELRACLKRREARR